MMAMLARDEQAYIAAGGWGRDNLLSATVLTHPPTEHFPVYKVQRFHKEIGSALMAAERGELTRLIVNMPPQLGKSALCTISFPIWCIGRHPDWPVIVASHTEAWAEDLGRKARDCANSARLLGIFPNLIIRQDTNAKSRWSTVGGADMTYTGIGGPITGKPAKIFIIDDPVKDFTESRSKATKDMHWGWYLSTAQTRLQKGGVLIIPMTRWAEDDLVGRILQREPGQWKVLKYPMLNANGGSLWPEERTPEWCAQTKDDYSKTPIGREIWAGMYQQEPYADGGGHFLTANWKWFPMGMQLPQGTVIQSWDTALKEGEENDYSVCLTIKATSTGHFILDCFRDHLEYPALIFHMKRLAALHKPSLVLIEDKASGTSAIQTLQRETRLPIKAINPEKDKVLRAWTGANLQSTGQVFLPQGAPWVDDLIREFGSFPAGPHDDMVDAFSQFANEAQTFAPMSIHMVPRHRAIGGY